MKRIGTTSRHGVVTAICAAIALASAASGCSGDSNAGSDSGTFKIGLVDSSAGPYASSSADFVAGVKYAVEEINGDGGINGHQIELVQGDLQGDPANGSTLVPKLLDQDIVAMLGPATSGEAEIAFAISNKFKVPSISAAGREGVLEGARPFGWTLTQPDSEVTPEVLGHYIAEEGVQTAAIIGDSVNTTTAAQVPAFHELFDNTGVKVVEEQEFSSGDSSFAAQVTAIKAAKPDVIALAAGPDDAGRIATEIRSQGLTVPLLGTAGLQSAAATYIAAGGDATEGTVTASEYDADAAEDPQASLQAQARKDLGLDAVPWNIATGYDAVNLVAMILEEQEIDPTDDVNESREAINEGLTDLGDYEGMSGPLSFSEGGYAQRMHFLTIIEDGAFKIKQTVS